MPVQKELSILLADDDEDDRELFAEALAACMPDATLHTSVNGKELMAYLREINPDKLPDILLLDLNMPIKNGRECLTEIRSSETLRQIAIIIYSTSGNPDQIDDMYRQGADHYIRKPSSFSGLKEMIQLLGGMTWSGHRRPAREDFVLLQDAKYIQP